VYKRQVFDEIKAEMVKDSPAEKVLKLLPHIRKPIAFFATAYLMEESGADLTEKGLYFDSFGVHDVSNLNRGPASEQRIAAMIARNRMIGDRYLGLLKNYLLNHAEDWPEFTAPAGFILNRDNTDKKTFWA